MNAFKLAIFIIMIALSNRSFAATAKGIIDSVSDQGVIRGWACVVGQTKSVNIDIQVRDAGGNKTSIARSYASNYSEAAVDTACGHTGSRGRHRFAYTLTEAQKKLHRGKQIVIQAYSSDAPKRDLVRSGVFVVPQPAKGLGVIDSISDGAISGWACIKGSTEQTVVDFIVNGAVVASTMANMANESAVSTACGLGVQRSAHRFRYVLPNTIKAKYTNQRVAAKVRKTGDALSQAQVNVIPGEVKYDFVVNSMTRDNVSLQWDYTHTMYCQSISATAISFAGGNGTTNGASENYVKEVERILGKSCIRGVRVSVNPGTGSGAGDGGYWAHNTSYAEAAKLMTDIIDKGKNLWQDAKWQRPFQGKLIVLGSSAGGMIAASALEREVSYRELVDRTIMISSPLGVDVSEECSSITDDQFLKPWLDRIFRTGVTCTQCKEGQYCGMSYLKDVLEMSNRSVRPYVNNGHEIVILIGDEDKIGCINGSSCGAWNAASAALKYVDMVSIGQPSAFSKVASIADGIQVKNVFKVISGGTHDLWLSKEARMAIVNNVVAER